MALNGDAILIPEQITKGQIIAKIKEKMLAVGWADIASKPSTDGIVLYSPGEAGDKRLLINFDTVTYPNWDTDPTKFLIYMYMPYDYTPAAPGTAGTFTRRGTWGGVFVLRDYSGPSNWTNDGAVQVSNDYGSGVPIWTKYTMWYHCNKNRGIFIFEPPSSYNLPVVYMFIGYSNDNFQNELMNRGCSILMGGYYACAMFCTDSGGGTADRVSETMYTPNTYKSYSTGFSSGIPIYPLYYGNANEGIRGRYDSLFTIPYLTGQVKTLGSGGSIYYPCNPDIYHGMILQDGAEKYRVLDVSPRVGSDGLGVTPPYAGRNCIANVPYSSYLAYRIE